MSWLENKKFREWARYCYNWAQTPVSSHILLGAPREQKGGSAQGSAATLNTVGMINPFVCIWLTRLPIQRTGPQLPTTDRTNMRLRKKARHGILAFESGKKQISSFFKVITIHACGKSYSTVEIQICQSYTGRTFSTSRT